MRRGRWRVRLVSIGLRRMVELALVRGLGLGRLYESMVMVAWTGISFLSLFMWGF